MQAPPPSAWVCPLEPGALWASCSWEGSSPAAAAEMAGEGHRWSRFRRGSVSPDVPRTQSKEKKRNVNLWCRSNLESREATGKKCFDQNKTTLQVNKAMLTSADQRNGAIWASKTSPSPATKKSPGRKGCWEDESMLAFSDESVTTRYLWHSKEILKKEVESESCRLKIRTDLEDFRHLALLWEGTMVLYGQDDGHVGIDECRPANCFHHILRIRGEI